MKEKLEQVPVTGSPLHTDIGDGCVPCHPGVWVIGCRPCPAAGCSRESYRLSWTLAATYCCSVMPRVRGPRGRGTP